MGRMFDTYRPDIVAAQAAQIKADGYGAVGLYIFESSAFKKLLTASLAKEICQAGLYIVTVYENGSPTSSSYFSETKGIYDGNIAVKRAQEAGQPQNSPIYLTVDFDASESDLDAHIVPYFQKAHEIIRAAGYFVGVYGNGITLMKLNEIGYISFEWLSQSTGFAGYKERLSMLPLPNIIQGPVEKIYGIDADSDTTNGSAGGWKAH